MLASFLLAAVAASIAWSATIVPPADLGQLARESDAVVLAVAGDSRPLQHGRLPFTRTTFTVIDSVSGILERDRTFEVEVPGGAGILGAWAVSGSPAFSTGETYLLLLKAETRGAWQPTALAWGLLQGVHGRDGSELLAPLPEYRAMVPFARPDGVVPEPPGVYRLGAMLIHLRKVCDGSAAWDAREVIATRDVIPLEIGLLTAPTACSFMKGQDGSGIRWPFPTTAATIYADETGDPSIAGGGFAEVEGAISTWMNIDNTSMNVRDGGTEAFSFSSCAPGDYNDTPSGSNIVFNDPCEDIPDLSGSCSGTLAFGGPWYSYTKHNFDETAWYTATNWFVVVNQGAGCLGSTRYRQMLTHELGHGIGFGHVADASALMYSMCCNSLNATDTTCAQYLYPDGTPTPTPTPSIPSAPSWVSASDGSYTDRVRIVWNASSSAVSYEVWRSASASTSSAAVLGSTTGTAFSDWQALPGTTYWYWVTAITLAGSSPFSPGDPGYRGLAPTPTPTPTPTATPTPTPTATPTPNPAPPAAVGASDGAFADRIRILWSASTGATRYEVFRGASPDPTFASALAVVTTTSLDDRTATPGIIYWYCVRAWNGSGPSGFSPGDSGYRATVPAPTPTPEPPMAGFEPSPSQPLVRETVAFSDLSRNATTFSWDFGDGGTSTQRSPAHSYELPGTFAVTQRVSGPGGTASLTRQLEVVFPVEATTVAVVAHLQGVGGSQWRTDVALANPSDEKLPLRLEYTRSGTGTPRVRSLSLAQRAAILFSDILKTFFQVGDGRGSLRVIPPERGPAPSVSSRTYSTGKDGNLGQGLPALSFRSAGVVYLPGLFADSRYRSNIAVTAGEEDVGVAITLFKGEDGELGPTVHRMVPAGSQEQWALDELFPGSAEEGGPLSAEVATDHQAIVYASLADQHSQDSTFILAAAPAQAWLVPIVAHTTGLQGTFWRSDIGVYNPNPFSTTLTLEYLPADQDNSAGGPTAPVIIPPNGSQVVADVTRSLFGLSSGKGSLMVSAPEGIVISSRTYTDRADGATYGHGSPPLDPTSLTSKPRTLAGVRQGAGYRTNFGLVSGTDRVGVELILRDADGKVLATRSRSVAPRSLLQLTFQEAFPGVSLTTEVGSVEVVPDAALAAYLSVLDESSQDPILVIAP